MRRLRLHHQRGVTLIELLVASMIIAVSIAGMVTLWITASTMSVESSQKSAAYNIARLNMERLKISGFATLASILNKHGSNGATANLYLPSASTYYSALYYDATGGSESSTQGSLAYEVTITTSADKWTTDSPAVVASDALIAVDLKVFTISNGTVSTTAVYETGTNYELNGI